MKRGLVLIFTLMLTFSVCACSFPKGLLDSFTKQNGTAGEQPSSTAGIGTTAQNQPTGEAQEASQPGGPATAAKTVTVTLYFAAKDNGSLKQEVRGIEVIDGAILKACVLALIDGPETAGLVKTIPEGTVLRGISVKNNIATVDFSKEFEKAAGLSGITSRLSVVNTLTGIHGIEKVRFRIEGKDMKGASGEPLGEIGPAILDKDGKPVEGESRTVTLYFPDSQAMYVMPEKRNVILTNGETIEEAIIKELLKGPVSKELRAEIPAGTKLLSVSTKNGTCTLNLSSEFVDNSPGGTTSERMTLDSVVNSLTELESVKRVQFLIDGKKREIYTHAIFDKPFSRNEEGIGKSK